VVRASRHPGSADSSAKGPLLASPIAATVSHTNASAALRKAKAVMKTKQNANEGIVSGSTESVRF